MSKQGGSVKYIAGIAVIALVGYFLLTRTPESTMPAGSPYDQSSPPKAEPKVTNFESGQDFDAYMSHRAKQRRAMLRRQASGMAALAIDKDHPFLEYETNRFSRRCTPGDLDVIEHDLELLKFRWDQLAFALEPLSTFDGDFTPQRQQVSFEMLKTGTKGRFELSPPDEPIILGLFLCSFEGRLDRERPLCADLKPLSIGDLVTTQRGALTDDSKRAEYPENPKIYFFQLIVAGPNGVFIYENNQTLEVNIKRLRQALNIKAQSVLERNLRRGVRLMRKVESLPPMVSGNRITLMLPDRGDCPFILKP